MLISLYRIFIHSQSNYNSFQYIGNNVVINKLPNGNNSEIFRSAYKYISGSLAEFTFKITLTIWGQIQTKK